MQRILSNAMNVPLVFACALLGAAAAGCEVKTIGVESAGGLTCEEGETKDADDGCNTCTCEGGAWKCTEIACGEECVDGEVMPAPDGCNTCVCESGMWACTLLGCPATDGDPGGCGDGILQAPEQCDDGNNVSGDGCSATCTIEDGDTTTGGSGPGDDTIGDDSTGGDSTGTSSGGETAVCGDGNIDPGEACDDGNPVGGDGCSEYCKIEGGWQVQICPEPYKVDPYEIDAVAIVGDALQVDVSYGGGCETHEFSFCWEGTFAESLPVQTWAEISHNANGDACEAYFSEQLVFDLFGLRVAYQEAYQVQNGEIVLHLAGWDEPVLYAF